MATVGINQFKSAKTLPQAQRLVHLIQIDGMFLSRPAAPVLNFQHQLQLLRLAHQAYLLIKL